MFQKTAIYNVLNKDYLSRVVQGDASAVAGAQFFSERKKIVDHLIGFNVWFLQFYIILRGFCDFLREEEANESHYMIQLLPW